MANYCPTGYTYLGSTYDCRSCCDAVNGPPPPPPPPGGGTSTYKVEYLHTDALGSVRMVTDQAGAVLARRDYYPFGGEIAADENDRDDVEGYTAADPDARQRFTGKERDSESGLDYFGARYYSGVMGRFTSPDPFLVKPDRLLDPQRLNRYAYVRGDPIRFVDPDGRDLVVYYSMEGLEGDRAKWLNENLQEVLKVAQQKFTDAGVKRVEFRDLGSLDASQRAALDKGSPLGVSRLLFTNDRYPGIKVTPALNTMGYMHPDGARIAAVFMDRTPLPGQSGSLGACGLPCLVGTIAAHELGHSLGFDNPGHAGLGASLDQLADLARSWLGGSQDLMLGGRGYYVSRGLAFRRDVDKNIEAIAAVNAVGDLTPRARK